MTIKSVYGRKKGVVLVVVIGVMLTIVFLCLAVLYVMSQQARIAEHKIRRLRAYYAAMAGVVYAFDQLRQGNDPSGTPAFRIGSGIRGYPFLGLPVNINVVHGGGVDNTDKIEVTVDYNL